MMLSEFLASGKTTLADAAGNPLVWRGGTADSGSVFLAKASFLIRYPWDLLRANEQFVATLTANIIEGDIHPSAVIEGVIHLGPGTRILPGVFIEGNVVIGANCKIGPNCYIRGNTSIGDACHIGQSVEIKNCLILAQTHDRPSFLCGRLGARRASELRRRNDDRPTSAMTAKPTARWSTAC